MPYYLINVKLFTDKYLVSIQKAVILCGRISLGRQFGADAGLIKGYENEFGG